MLISVIIPAYNAAATLPLCIEACLKQSYSSIEVIVVDDGSTDDTAAAARRYPITYLQQKNQGPAAARNRGAENAQGSFLAFTDADCIPEIDWIEKLAAGLSTGVVGVGGSYGIANGDRLLAKMIHEEIMVRHSRFEGAVDYLGSFNVLYDAHAFRAVGGFDENFKTASGEDNDLAYRLYDKGGQLRFVQGAKVSHHYPTRLWPYLRTQARHGFWRVKLVAKHGRRKYGDQYASRFELTSIVVSGCGLYMAVALLLVGGAVLILESWSSTALLSGAIVAIIVLAFQLPLVVQMAARSGDARMTAFVVVKLLREAARVLGMMIGVVWFLALKRKTT